MNISPLTYINNHWNGSLKNWQLFWFNTISVMLILQITLFLIHQLIHEKSTYNDVIKYSVLILSWSLIALPIVIWQLTGNLRENRHSPLIIRLIKNITLFTVASLVVIQIILHIPSTLRYMQITFRYDAVSQTAARLRYNENHLEIEGSIDFTLPDRLKHALQQYPETQSIILNSSGGYMPPARRITEIIIQNKLNTHVEHSCQSACTLILLAGRKRTISQQAKIGFHRPSSIVISDIDPASRHKKDIAFLEAKKITRDFISKIYNTPTSKLWFPNHEKLIKSGFITEITRSKIK